MSIGKPNPFKKPTERHPQDKKKGDDSEPKPMEMKTAKVTRDAFKQRLETIERQPDPGKKLQELYVYKGTQEKIEDTDEKEFFPKHVFDEEEQKIKESADSDLTEHVMDEALLVEVAKEFKDGKGILLTKDQMEYLRRTVNIVKHAQLWLDLQELLKTKQDFYYLEDSRPQENRGKSPIQELLGISEEELAKVQCPNNVVGPLLMGLKNDKSFSVTESWDYTADDRYYTDHRYLELVQLVVILPRPVQEKVFKLFQPGEYPIADLEIFKKLNEARNKALESPGEDWSEWKQLMKEAIVQIRLGLSMVRGGSDFKDGILKEILYCNRADLVDFIHKHTPIRLEDSFELLTLYLSYTKDDPEATLMLQSLLSHCRVPPNYVGDDRALKKLVKQYILYLINKKRIRGGTDHFPKEMGDLERLVKSQEPFFVPKGLYPKKGFEIMVRGREALHNEKNQDILIELLKLDIPIEQKEGSEALAEGLKPVVTELNENHTPPASNKRWDEEPFDLEIQTTDGQTVKTSKTFLPIPEVYQKTEINKYFGRKFDAETIELYLDYSTGKQAAFQVSPNELQKLGEFAVYIDNEEIADYLVAKKNRLAGRKDDIKDVLLLYPRNTTN